eukprot:637359-Prorocentrum_minimum.AAC.1
MVCDFRANEFELRFRCDINITRARRSALAALHICHLSASDVLPPLEPRRVLVTQQHSSHQTRTPHRRVRGLLETFLRPNHCVRLMCPEHRLISFIHDASLQVDFFEPDAQVCNHPLSNNNIFNLNRNWFRDESADTNVDDADGTDIGSRLAGGVHGDAVVKAAGTGSRPFSGSVPWNLDRLGTLVKP